MSWQIISHNHISELCSLIIVKLPAGDEIHRKRALCNIFLCTKSTVNRQNDWMPLNLLLILETQEKHNTTLNNLYFANVTYLILKRLYLKIIKSVYKFFLTHRTETSKYRSVG
jgi:hypothetical protein